MPDHQFLWQLRIGPSVERPRPVLVVDFGTSTLSGMLVAEGREHLLMEPVSGSSWWPSTVCATDEGPLVGTRAEQRRLNRPGAYRAEVKRLLGQSGSAILADREYAVESLVAALLRAFRDTASWQLGVPVSRILATVPAAYDEMADPRRAAMLEAGRVAGFVDVELLAEPIAVGAARTGGPYRDR